MSFTKKVLFLPLFFASVSFSLLAEHNFFEKNPNGVVYPAGFLKGVAFSCYQNGGHNYWKTVGYRPKSNWTWFEHEFKTRFLIDREREGGVSPLFVNLVRLIEEKKSVFHQMDGGICLMI